MATTTGDAATELSSAAEYQRKAGRRAACLMLILVFVVAIVLVAVSSALVCSPCFRLIVVVGFDVMDSRNRYLPPACVSLWNQQYRISHLYNRMLTTVHFCVAFSDNIPLVHENPAPG